MTRAALALLVAVAVAGGIAGRASAPVDTAKPARQAWHCPEDAALVGFGSFDGQRWTRYQCIATDDLGLTR